MAKKPVKKTAAKKSPPKRPIAVALALGFLGGAVIVGLFLLLYRPALMTSPAQPEPQLLAPAAQPADYPAELPTEPVTSPLSVEDRPEPGSRPQVAIIMDDIGISYRLGMAAINLNLPLSLAIIPGEAYSSELMNIAHQRQFEIMIHLPMEPINYPQNNPGALALFVTDSDETISRRTRQLIELVPFAVGCNNHMGSEFTRHAKAMMLVLREIKAAQLFFVDSLTFAQSVAYAQAQQLGVPSAARDTFLDNERDVEKILTQLRALIEVAKENGQAIGICHPYPETIAALSMFGETFNSDEIELVPASQLVH